MAQETVPAGTQPTTAAPHLVLAPTYKDPTTGALYVHQDYNLQAPPWEEQAHISPPRGTEIFGDVPSWAAFVRRYGHPPATFATWNSAGLKAVLDYHENENDPGRCQWTAHQPFTRSAEWEAWWVFASNVTVAQKTAIEKMEDLAETIVEPAAADLLNLLRVLRANVNTKAESALNEDGSTAVSFEQAKTLRGVSLPPTIKIAIPVLAGHPARYAMSVRVRPSVDNDARLTFRFILMNQERVLEDVFAERVSEAQTILGDTYPILRAAG